MSVFEVSRMVTARQCAERYGVKFGRNGRAYCPFHAGGMEKHPALSFKDGGFNCFVCGAKGDSIKFVEMLMRVKPLQAAQIINEEFRCGLEDKPLTEEEKQKLAEADRLRAEKAELLHELDDVLMLIWREDMKPIMEGEFGDADWDKLSPDLTAALSRRAGLEYLGSIVNWKEMRISNGDSAGDETPRRAESKDNKSSLRKRVRRRKVVRLLPEEK